MPTGIHVLPALVALAALALLLLPFGAAATWPATRRLARLERWLAAAAVGYPLSAASYQVLAWARTPALFGVLWLVLLVVAVHQWRREEVREPAPEPARGGGTRLAALTLAIAAGILWLWTRDARALEPVPEGQAYRHSVDHAVHLALYWEMMRGLPPDQLPTAAGLPFPSYHTLAFVPGVLLASHAGLHVTTVYHVVSPLLRLTLLMAAVYLAVRLRTGDRRLAAAVLPGVLVLGPWVEHRLGERIVAGPSPYYFFARNEPGGGAIVVWAVVGFLLALYERQRHPRALVLAAVVAGLAFGFKAQMFVLFAPAFFLALGVLLLRERTRAVAAAIAFGLAAFAAMFVTARGRGPLGTLHFTPGLFVRMYVHPALAGDPWPWIHRDLLGFLARLPVAVDGLASASLAVWRLASLSPAVPWMTMDRLRRWRSAGPLDLVFVLVFVVAVPLGIAFSATSIDREVSPFEFMQAAHGLAFWAAAANVIGLAWLLGRTGRDAGGITLAVVLAASLAAVPSLLRAPDPVAAREGIVLGPDETCALRFLRDQTSFTAVTVGWRDLPVGAGGAPRRLNHQAVLAGLAGRRSVLEYYAPAVDPRTDRERAVRQLFTTADQKAGEAILDRYQVEYVVELPGKPLCFESPRLETAYLRGGIRVRRVHGGSPALLVAPPQAWAEAPDLSCPD